LYWPQKTGIAIRTDASDITPRVDTRGHDAE
jgi:hypothetical protein